MVTEDMSQSLRATTKPEVHSLPRRQALTQSLGTPSLHTNLTHEDMHRKMTDQRGRDLIVTVHLFYVHDPARCWVLTHMNPKNPPLGALAAAEGPT